MSEIDILLKVIEKIGQAFGPIYGTLLFLLLAGIVGILFFFKSRIGSIAEQISNQAVLQFGKKLDIVFRDETIRSNLTYHLAQKSVERKLDLYQKVYSLYFDYQKSWAFDSQTPQNDYNSLWLKIVNLRQELFLNSIYLGGDLSTPLLDAVITMLNNLDERGKRPAKVVGMSGITTASQSEPDPTKHIDEASKWLERNLFTHQALSMYEFTEDQKVFLKEQRDRVVSSDLQGRSPKET
jgi:hypothetical protein